MLKTVARLLALYRVAAVMDLVWVARDFRNFVTFYGCELVLGVGSVTTTLLLAERFGGIGGWSRDQVIFMLGYAAVASGLLEVLCGFNIRFISRQIGRGQLDHALVQPHRLPVFLLT